MSDNFEQKGIEHLEKIEQELGEIKERTGGRWNSLRNGLWQGMGAVVGSVFGVILIGAFLTLFGIIPGLGELREILQNAFDALPRR